VKQDAFGEKQYRRGALERLEEAGVLLRRGLLGGAVYMAGRGVEGSLRAVIWRRDTVIRGGRKSLETGHDLRELLALVTQLGLLADDRRDDTFRDRVAHVARLWQNNLRFASARFIETRWVVLAEVRPKRKFKQVAEGFYDACSEIIKRCEVICEDSD
jgi:HEPN domain-containing protein